MISLWYVYDRKGCYVMNKFKDIIKNCNKNKGIIYKNNIEIINENKKDEYYIDSRTEREENKVDELNIVYAFCYYNGHYWYVCPDCGQIHTSEIIGKIQTGCCMDIDCERYSSYKGKCSVLKRQPIYLEEGEEI